MHIAPPSPGGVSRNQYEHFNVPAAGLILNNSAQRTTTVLGGGVAGNPQLGGQPARIIVNEVTSASPSTLRGALEVAGPRADLVVANPNGIHCDACGFLNAGRTTLTTGLPIWNGTGSILGFHIEKGVLSVGNGGLDARDLHQLDLLARGIVIEGVVQSQKIHAIAGANQVDYGDAPAVQSLAAGGGDAPKFAVDIGKLGGMYAGQIYMLATERGMGVNSEGRLVAHEGSLRLGSDGDLRVHQAYGQQGVNLASAGGDVSVSGEVASPAQLNISAGQVLRNGGLVAAGEGLSVQALEIDNAGALVGGTSAMADRRGVDADPARAAGSLLLSGNVHNRADALVFSAGDLTVNGSLHNVGGAVHAWGNIKIIGHLTNENAGFRTVRETSTSAPNELYYSDELAPADAHRADDVRFDRQQNLVLPSTQFPFEQFGHEAYDSVLLPNAYLSAEKFPGARYADSDPVWARFGVKAPDFSDLDSHASLPGTDVCVASDNYEVAVEARRTQALAELQLKLDAFNTDLEKRRTASYFSHSVDQHQITEDRVVASQPGQMIAGSSISVAGGTNRDSLVAAGGQFFSSRGFSNHATEGRRTVTAHGRLQRSWSEAALFRDAQPRLDEPVLLTSLVSEQTFPLDAKPMKHPIGARDTFLVKPSPWGELPKIDRFASLPNSDKPNGGQAFPWTSAASVNFAGHGELSGLAVPLAPATKDTQGSLLAASDIRVLAPGESFTNSGALLAHGDAISTGSLTVEADRISHRGTLSAHETVLRATQDIAVTGGQFNRPGDSGPTGYGSRIDLQAGRNIQLQSEVQPLSQSLGIDQAEAHIASRTTVLSAERIDLRAGQDLLTEGVVVTAGDTLMASADRHIDIGPAFENRSTQASAIADQGEQSSLWSQSASTLLGSQLRAKRLAHLNAGEQLTFTGSLMASENDLQLNARHISIESAETQQELSVRTTRGADLLHTRTFRQTPVESRLSADNHVQLIADEDIGIAGSLVDARLGLASLVAGHDVHIKGVSNSFRHERGSDASHGWWFARHGVSSNHLSAGSSIKESQIEGHRVSMKTGRDAKVSGSSVSSTQSLEVHAGRDVEIVGMKNVYSEDDVSKDKKRGFFITGASLALGWRDLSKESQTTGGKAERSTVGSLGGSVNIEAKGSYTQGASDLLAFADIDVRARDIQLLEVVDASRRIKESETSERGLGLGVGMFGFLGIGGTAWLNAKLAVNAPSGRVAALHSLAALRGLRIAGGMFYSGKDEQGLPTPAPVRQWKGFTGGLRTGVLWNDFSHMDQSLNDTVQIAKISGGGLVKLQADPHAGKLHSAGAAVHGGQVHLIAHDIELGAAQAHDHQDSREHALGFSVGAIPGASLGVDGWAYYSEDAATRGKKHPHLTQVSAAKKLSVRSVGNIGLRGALLEAESVAVAAGNQLLIESSQESANGRADKTAADVFLGTGGGMSYGGISGARGEAQLDHAIVSKPSGIFAGQGGFDMEVGGVTRLVGGLIDSQAPASSNRLTTGSLETQDITTANDSYAVTMDGYIGYSDASPSNLGRGVSAYPGVPQSEGGRQTMRARSAIAPGAIVFTQVSQSAGAEQLAVLSRDPSYERGIRFQPPPADPSQVLAEHATLGWAIAAAVPLRLVAEWGAFADGRLTQAQESGNVLAANCWSAQGACRAVGPFGIDALTGMLGLR